MAEETVSILMVLKDQVTATADRIRGGLDGVRNVVSSLQDAFSPLTGTVAKLITGYVTFNTLFSSIDKARGALESEHRLQAALKDDFAAVIEQRAQIKALSDEVVAGQGKLRILTANLVQYGVPTDQLEKARRTAVDIAAALGRDVETLGREIGGLYEGYVTRTLIRLEPRLKGVREGTLSAAEAIDLLGKRFEGAGKAFAESTLGQLELAERRVSAAKTRLGKAILPIELGFEGVKASTLEAIGDIVNSGVGKAVIKLFQDGLKYLEQWAPSIVGAVAALQAFEYLAPFVKVVGAALAFIFSPGGIIVIGIGLVLFYLGKMTGLFESVGQAIDYAKKQYEEFDKRLRSGKLTLDDVFSFVSEKFGRLWTEIKYNVLLVAEDARHLLVGLVQDVADFILGTVAKVIYAAARSVQTFSKEAADPLYAIGAEFLKLQGKLQFNETKTHLSTILGLKLVHDTEISYYDDVKRKREEDQASRQGTLSAQATELEKVREGYAKISAEVKETQELRARVKGFDFLTGDLSVLGRDAPELLKQTEALRKQHEEVLFQDRKITATEYYDYLGQLESEDLRRRLRNEDAAVQRIEASLEERRKINEKTNDPAEMRAVLGLEEDLNDALVKRQKVQLELSAQQEKQAEQRRIAIREEQDRYRSALFLDPEVNTRARQLQRQLVGISNEQAQILAAFLQIRDAAEAPLEGFFENLITRAKSLKEALADLVQSFAQAIAKLVASEAAKGFLNLVTGSVLGSQGVAVPAGTAPAASGGLFGAIGHLLGFAGGGLVPGHDSTADQRLVRLTGGEYVHRQAAVDYYGRTAMEAVNRMAVPAELLRAYRAPIPVRAALAAGGPAALAAGTQPIGRSFVVGDELALDRLLAGGGSALHRWLRGNREAVNSALGR